MNAVKRRAKNKSIKELAFITATYIVVLLLSVTFVVYYLLSTVLHFYRVT